MKSPPPIPRSLQRRPNSIARCCSRFATVLACLGLGLGLLAPVFKSAHRNGHPVPRGQLRADLRTLVATVRYLVQSESEVRMKPAGLDGATPMLAQGTNNRPFEMFPGFSNQLWRCEGSSNSPA